MGKRFKMSTKKILLSLIIIPLLVLSAPASAQVAILTDGMPAENLSGKQTIVKEVKKPIACTMIL